MINSALRDARLVGHAIDGGALETETPDNATGCLEDFANAIIL